MSALNRTGRLGPSIVVAGLATLLSAPIRAQEHEHGGKGIAHNANIAQLRIPEALQREHAELHAELARAAEAGGKIGDAAQEVARVLYPHFQREEEIALPPLGLLEALVVADATPEFTSLLALTDTLKAEIPRMLEEHAAVRVALENLAAVARAENQPAYVDFAERIMHHARLEEQVTYPAAILVGDYIRLLLIYESRDASALGPAIDIQTPMPADPPMHRMMMRRKQDVPRAQDGPMMQLMHGQSRDASECLCHAAARPEDP